MWRVFEAGLAACLGELARAIAGSVIGKYGLEACAERAIRGEGGLERSDGGAGLLVGLDAGRADAAVIADGDVDVLEAASAHTITLAAGDVERAVEEAPELLNNPGAACHLGTRARSWVDDYGLQVTDVIELQTAQDAADRGPAQGGVDRDPVAGPALTAQSFCPIHSLAGRGPIEPVRTRCVVRQSRRASFPIPIDPLGQRLFAQSASMINIEWKTIETSYVGMTNRGQRQIP